MTRVFIVSIFLIIISLQILQAQNLHRRFDGMPVIVDGNTCVNPFNGGLETPRYQFADIDGDSDLDLFIFDKDTTLNYYRNTGSSTNGVFVLFSTRYENLNIRNWFEFADLDNDGDKDLLCGGDSQRVRYYKNIGSPPSPNFMLQTYGVKTDLNEYMVSESASSPTLADVDGDGN
ncbi:MAG TPA: VCBS repeat-containing protein, partial [Ignavibacteria bacterium]|nr:VCBS repeat-containing protein [Ignavibacteria bacterium]